MDDRPGPAFAVLYRWRLVPGREASFEAAWARMTERIAADAGGLGSRLHRAADGTWAAYAQWPDRAAWEAMALDDAEAATLRRTMADAVAETLPTETFEIVRDLFRP